jgi:putative endonuclease
MILRMQVYHVYILTNYSRTVLYTGVTNNLDQRIIEHYLNRNDEKTFTGKYKTYYLLFYEAHQYILNAIAREKEIKGWSRAKKLAMVQSFNPEMIFLNKEVLGKWPPDEVSHRKDLQ